MMDEHDKEWFNSNENDCFLRNHALYKGLDLGDRVHGLQFSTA